MVKDILRFCVRFTALPTLATLVKRAVRCVMNIRNDGLTVEGTANNLRGDYISSAQMEESSYLFVLGNDIHLIVLSCRENSVGKEPKANQPPEKKTKTLAEAKSNVTSVAKPPPKAKVIAPLPKRTLRKLLSKSAIS